MDPRRYARWLPYVAMSRLTVLDWALAEPVWRTTLNKALVLIPVLVLAAGFVVFCEVDLARAKEVRYLPKWVWAILCMGIGLTIPFGGITYLVFGKVRRPRPG
jgi:hypothetical protein